MNIEELNAYMNAGNKMEGGSIYHRQMSSLSEQARKITSKINNQYHTEKELQQLFSLLTGKRVDSSFRLFPPFYTDYGKNIHIGKNIFINGGCHFQDQGGVVIGDNSLIGHNVVFATLNHGFEANDRDSLYPAAIRIDKNVWIGSNATILPGVTIGENAIVAAGAVVTKDVAANTVVAGVPAKYIRSIDT